MTIITDQLHYDKKVHIIPLVKRKEKVNDKLFASYGNLNLEWREESRVSEKRNSVS